ncbi:tigger transposable element-derived protein 6-like [Daktulosphaira vitifoliae]|uniref:tigger transposable element-derived protein 6-like n=1 Tax=Daktulosphaira vitifoliae TaxID=58002 RepID=UPI0021AAC939|nr:tigger transposable element-derived protein 6-like [Daktulosphaira vitifoliae]
MGNLEVLFFPPNMTSVVQPMDQGIIKNFKHHYRTLLVLNLLQDGGKIDILQANRMSKNAWEQVTSETIANCFRKAGFLSGNSENVGNEEIQQTITINVWDDVRQGVNINFDDYINMDDDLQVRSMRTFIRFRHYTINCKMYTIIG